MKFTIGKAELKEILTGIITGRVSSLSVCSVWKIEAGEKGVMFSLFSITESATVKVYGENKIGENEKKVFFADHNKMILAVKAALSKSLVIDFEVETLDGINIATEVTGLDGHLPELNTADAETTLEFIADVSCFDSIFSLAFPHVSEDETRYFMCGVYLESEDGDINVVATNGRSLYLRKSILGQCLSKGSAIVPPKAFNKIKKTKNINVRILENKKAARKFCKVTTSGDWFMATKITECIDGQFPNYRRVIPEDTLPNFFVDSSAFRDALKGAEALTGKNSNRVLMTVNGNRASVTADGEGATKKDFFFDCESALENYSIAFNVGYMLSSLPKQYDVGICFCKDSSVKAFTVDNNGMTVIMPMAME
jgi:DNA polymerase III sliding clamp (beta) subunit (PCNA family)